MSESSRPPRRRVLHVFATFGIGGPQMRQAQLIERMGSGYVHDVVAMDGEFAMAQRIDKALLGELLPPPGGRSFVSSTRAFCRLLKARDPDLLLTYNWGSIEACAAARVLDLRRHVHHEEGFRPDEQERRLARRNWMRRLFLARAHAVVVVSSGLLDIARFEWKVAVERLQLLPNGVELARFMPATSPLPAPPVVIGAVGGLRAEKDHATLLAAFARLRSEPRLLLVGDGPERARLEELAQRLGIASRVEFAGTAKDTAPSYRRMHVFALSSRTEQMPISLLEAMASGLPVASTDVGDVRAMLPDGSRGGVCAKGDPAALAAALQGLVDDAGRRAREGAANRAHVEREFELGTCLDRYVALYERAARRP